MKADLMKEQLHLVLENDFEKMKVYKFLQKLYFSPTQSCIIGESEIQIDENNKYIGLYLEVLNGGIPG